MDKKIDFLYAAIEDTQELIKFIENKTALLITLQGFYIFTLLNLTEKIIEHHKLHSLLFYLLLVFLSLTLLISIYLTVRIIKPTNNPKENIQIDEVDYHNLDFFISENDYDKVMFTIYKNSKKHKLKVKFSFYYNEIINLKDADIIKILTIELHKLSFIRNIKKDRLNELIKMSIITTVLFIIFYFCYQIESYQITNYLNVLK
jgi:hypothetical protein